MFIKRHYNNDENAWYDNFDDDNYVFNDIKIHNYRDINHDNDNKSDQNINSNCSTNLNTNANTSTNTNTNNE